MRLLTAIAVIVHTLLGCCALDAHAAATPCENERPHLCEQQAFDASHDDDTDHAPHGCCHQQCHLWSSDAGPGNLLCGVLLNADACDASRAVADAHRVLSTARDGHDAPSALPVRLHLAKSVLLI